MHPLSARELLEVWEVGETQHPVDRALTLLAAAHPDRSRGDLAELSLGERDARLLALRESLFGSALVCVMTCPRCQERLELSLSTAELRALSRQCEEPGGDPARGVSDLTCGSYAIRLRLPTSKDLVAASRAEDLAHGRRLLAERCVEEATCDGSPVGFDALPAAVIDRLSDRLSECDPGAETRIDVRCPECGLEERRLLDVGEFLWAELGSLAQRLLAEVDALARTYHWSESEILGMTARRRHAYLEMLA